MAELMSDKELTALLSEPRTPLPVCATIMYDGQTGIDLCVKFINRKPVCAVVGRGEGAQRKVGRIEKHKGKWGIPDAWKQKEVIRQLLKHIETEEAKHDREIHVA